MKLSQKINQKVILEQYLPHNFLAEKTVLNCLLINPDFIQVADANLPVEAFYFNNNQEIYKSLIFMYKNELKIDVLTLITFLQDNGLLKKIGGIQVFIELLQQIPNLNYFEDYLRLIKDKFLRRQLIQLGYEIINSGYTTNISLENILNNFENKFLNICNHNKTHKILNTAEILNNVFFELKEKFLNKNLAELRSGFYDLDLLIQGFHKSDLIIIAGRPGTGKTAFGLNIALNCLKQIKSSILFFSLEMSREQIIYRLLSIESNINQTKLKNGQLSNADWQKLNTIIKILSRVSFFVDDTPNLSVQNIQTKIKQLQFEHGKIDLVIIDYLQLMQGLNSKIENRVQELSNITRALKNIARSFDIPIIALSQLNRNVDNRINNKPILSDLRESGSIEQDADLILMLYKNKKDLNLKENELCYLTELIVAKHRNGPTGTIKLKFNPGQTKFSNFDL